MPTPLVWLFGGLFAATAVQQVLKPRLPEYQLDVRILNDPFKAATQHYWIQGGTTGSGKQSSYYASAVPAAVSFFNDNFINLDVHALHFDLFYMDWDGRLQRIGELKDRQQVEPPQQQQHKQHAKSNHNTTMTTTVSSSYSSKAQRQPLWRIPGRSNFSVHDTLYVGSIWSCLKGMMFNSRFYWSWWKGGGHLALPTTGVAHLRANGQARLTVSFVCDNIINTWTLRVQGVDCQLRQMSTGWANLTAATDQLRAYAIDKLVALENGHVITKATAESSSAKNLKNSDDWLKEAMV